MANTPAPSAGLVAPPAAPESTPARQETQTLASLLRRQEQAIAAALPRHITPERFARVALTALRSTPKLDQCTPTSFLGALMTAAQLGLEPNTPLGHAYLIPFRNTEKRTTECTFILGYKGIIDLARRNGVAVNARTVYEGDEFECDYGLAETIVHKPTLGDRGPVIAYYGVARWDGGHMVDMATPVDIEARKARSKAASKGPWVSDYDAMARKTVVRMMAPYLPLSIEMATAVASDERAINMDIDTGDILDLEPLDDDTADDAGAEGDQGEAS